MSQQIRNNIPRDVAGKLVQYYCKKYTFVTKKHHYGKKRAYTVLTGRTTFTNGLAWLDGDVNAAKNLRLVCWSFSRYITPRFIYEKVGGTLFHRQYNRLIRINSNLSRHILEPIQGLHYLDYYTRNGIAIISYSQHFRGSNVYVYVIDAFQPKLIEYLIKKPHLMLNDSFIKSQIGDIVEKNIDARQGKSCPCCHVRRYNIVEHYRKHIRERLIGPSESSMRAFLESKPLLQGTIEREIEYGKSQWDLVNLKSNQTTSGSGKTISMLSTYDNYRDYMNAYSEHLSYRFNPSMFGYKDTINTYQPLYITLPALTDFRNFLITPTIKQQQRPVAKGDYDGDEILLASYISTSVIKKPLDRREHIKMSSMAKKIKKSKDQKPIPKHQKRNVMGKFKKNYR